MKRGRRAGGRGAANAGRRAVDGTLARRPLAYPVPVDVIEELIDQVERLHGGKWREGRRLLPGEVVIVDERLT